MHLNFDDTVTLTRFTTSAFDVEGKTSRIKAVHLSILCGRKQLANIPKHTGVRCRVGPRRTPDGRLININDFIQKFDTLNGFAFSGVGFGAVEFCG